MIWSNLSSALYTVSLAASVSRFFIFILTTEPLRPERLYSALRITIGSAPTMMTLPARSSCAVFMFTTPQFRRRAFYRFSGKNPLDSTPDCFWPTAVPSPVHGAPVRHAPQRTQATHSPPRPPRSMPATSLALPDLPPCQAAPGTASGRLAAFASAPHRAAGKSATRTACPPIAPGRRNPRHGRNWHRMSTKVRRSAPVRQTAARAPAACPRRIIAEILPDLRQDPPLRHETQHRLHAVGPCIKQPVQCGIFITEQRDF